MFFSVRLSSQGSAASVTTRQAAHASESGGVAGPCQPSSSGATSVMPCGQISQKARSWVAICATAQPMLFDGSRRMTPSVLRNPVQTPLKFRPREP